MATPGRIVAALASGSQETTLALAHINFDFSLIKTKLDAPPSFRGVGNLLSRKRKAAAESGSSHITARKLGALFEQMLPNTPCLVENYGMRASEIVQLSEKEECQGPTYGMFADQAGVDATSIWAAATSGKSAISVHLLACMLARMFPGPEATSIWAELIEERKKQLASDDLSTPYHVSTVLAAQISLSRDQLAEWDNSARSWLRAADEAKSMQQTQLLLIIKNINVPVNQENGNLYRSVISAWKSALELMENLFRGTAQCITPYEGNGALLLALSSWHIYPDMDVLGNQKVTQKDPLVPSEAILTVGLECSPAQQDIGVHWSLPLAHYRFYGPPKVSEHSLCSDAERVSFEQFSQVALGSFLRQWDYEGYDIVDYAKLVIRLYDYLTADRATDAVDQDTRNIDSLAFLKSDPNWLKYLAKAGKMLVDSSGPSRAMYKRLVGVGMRRGQRFIHTQPPMFGLSSFHDFFAMLVGTEFKIQALRRLADRLDLGSKDALIRYRNPNFNEDGSRKGGQGDHEPNTRAGDLDPTPLVRPPNPLRFAKSSILSISVGIDDYKGSERPDDSILNRLDSSSIPTHYEDDQNMIRSVDPTHVELGWNPIDPNLLFRTPENAVSYLGFNTITVKGKATAVPYDYFSYASVIPQDKASAKRSWEGSEVKYLVHRRWVPANQRRTQLEPKPGEDTLDLEELHVFDSGDDHITLGKDSTISIKIGDPNDCAFFAVGRSWRLQTTLEDIIWAFESGAFDTLKLAKYLSSGERLPPGADKNESRTKPALARRALATVFDIYDQFSKATVALKAIEMPLLKQEWTLCTDISEEIPDDSKSDADTSKKNRNASESHTAGPEDHNASIHVNITKRAAPEGLDGLSSFEMTRGDTFALLAAFETGFLNLDPSTLNKVMAMSSGDSIFVATQLLVDPLDSTTLEPSSICRIRGNIGKPGVAMLISPPELQVRPRNSANWAVINHTPFNGELIDSFQGTSLHLSFTEYSRAMDTGIHGVRDAEVYFLEAFVQVYFKGQWIGDADIISGLESNYIHIFDLQSLSSAETDSCRHSAKNMRTFRVIAIDNWDEFVDIPNDGIVVRAKDNWLARLAATCLSVQRKDETIVMNPNASICWPCVRDEFSLRPAIGNHAFIC